MRLSRGSAWTGCSRPGIDSKVNTVTPGRLGDRDISEAVVVAATTTVGEALAQAEQRWLVILGADGAPVTAVHPDSLGGEPAECPLADVVSRLPPVVIASRSMPMTTLLASWVIDELEPGSVIVVMDGDQVAGIWAGPDMLAMMALGRSRSFWDSELPGEIKIPLLTRACRYREGDTACTAVLQFPERPRQLVECPNPALLAAHEFAW